MTVPAATLPVLRALLDEAHRRRYRGGVLAVSAKPDWDGPADFEHDGVPVRVVGCPSTLAVREALLDRAADRWLILLTDRDDSELGLGITAHLTWQRTRRPDPWAAVQDRFEATRIDHRLVSRPDNRDLALGLLSATPSDGWPPARAALLTRDHALSAVAASRLGLGRAGEPLDFASVLRWTTRDEAANMLAGLRSITVEALVGEVLTWAAERCGTTGPAVAALLRGGRTGDVVPLGLVARAVLATPGGSGPRALFGRETGVQLPDHVVTAWATEAEAVVRDLISGDQEAAARVLARAETLLDALEAVAHAGESNVLRRGLTARLAELGEALRRCVARSTSRAGTDGADAVLADVLVLPDVERARERVEDHALARHADEVRVPRAIAGVRLARWLAQRSDVSGDLGALTSRHRDDDAWADRAIAAAWTGVDDESLAQGLRAVLEAARLRRDVHDRDFGRALAKHSGSAPDGLYYLEDMLAATVLPLAKDQPVLLVVADGMSQAVATEVVDDLVRRYDTWLECLPEKNERRLAALAVLPSLTEVSRASLLSGTLAVGQQNVEQRGLSALAKSHGVRAELFHKLTLDTSPDGYALALDVAAAIDNTDVALVVCVLNTIDDSLDRSNPGGTAWTADAVKHLRPLMERARRAGRLVVLTSDHGHVVERRQGRQQAAAGTSSNRSRPAAGGPGPTDDEVRVSGPRVLLHDGNAILAVNERLRYGPLKAGYHGGAAPAEVVVPISVLAPGEPPTGWRLAPPQSPSWWRSAQAPAPSTHPAAVPAAKSARAVKDQQAVPTLFDTPDEPVVSGSRAEAVLVSAAYRDQRKRSARVAISDVQVRRLLDALLEAPAHRLDPESAAAALGVATVQLGGALPQVQRLLNVEQYPVLSRDPDGATVVLDVDLLGDQFGVRL
ncbi:BREX-2 system phosphatase PglZ [Actinoplanes oblitus]|uniref:BREX-2 system phosphatase PglZ n=1 Tax=Actinoplanes oblitus TaxID=3040509 RepID=A0ABY8WH48_9ACTN|nr:BREX-2 system phosphatase PglZ [Actinoplanes oblitus]WIM96998.1 BREX-2 system phosphatase PglZ [Actinoplanes oblitus]